MNKVIHKHTTDEVHTGGHLFFQICMMIRFSVSIFDVNGLYQNFQKSVKLTDQMSSVPVSWILTVSPRHIHL